MMTVPWRRNKKQVRPKEYKKVENCNHVERTNESDNKDIPARLEFKVRIQAQTHPEMRKNKAWKGT